MKKLFFYILFSIFYNSFAFECNWVDGDNNICGKMFNRRFTLNRHHKTHIGETLYTCEECHKCFSEKGNLMKHKKIHTGEKTFQCKSCPKKFITKSKLNLHETIHTGEKKFNCHFCNYSSNNQSNLKKHLRTHSNERPYLCYEENCNKSFFDQSNLQRHKQKIHTQKNQNLEKKRIKNSEEQNKKLVQLNVSFNLPIDENVKAIQKIEELSNKPIEQEFEATSEKLPNYTHDVTPEEVAKMDEFLI